MTMRRMAISGHAGYTTVESLISELRQIHKDAIIQDAWYDHAERQFYLVVEHKTIAEVRAGEAMFVRTVFDVQGEYGGQQAASGGM